MIFAIIFAQLWGVIQLIVLASLARTVRVRTVLAAMAVGFYAIGPVTAFIQLSWIRIAAHVFGKAVSDLTGVASYTVDPFIEEAMKLLPLLVLLLIPAIRRQWSVTDCTLIAGATGSGFGLAEHLFRYADYANIAQSVSGGYIMTIGSATPFVPGIVRTLTSWIPLGVYFESNAVHINWHLAWSAITGLAVGLFLRNPKKWARPAAVGVVLLVCVNHAAGNAAGAAGTWLSWIAAPMRLLDSVLWLLVLVAVGAAWWLDQPSQRAGMSLGPLLAAEQSAPSRLAGTFNAAVSRVPWSIFWVCGFDRARRAYHAARAAAPGSLDDMRDAIVAQRDSVDRRLTQQAAPPLVPLAWMPNNVGATVRSALRRPPVIIYLVLVAPSVLYLIIGGFPALSGLQTVMKGPIVWPVVLLITLLGRGRSAWRVLGGIRKLPAAVRHPIGDDAAMLTLQAASGLGTLSLAGFTLARVLSGVGAGERMLSATHAADAINRTQPAGGAAVAGSAGAFEPPPTPPSAAASAAPAAPGSGAGEGTNSSTGGSTPNAGSSGDSPRADRPAHEMPVNEAKAPSTAAPADGDGMTPLAQATQRSDALPDFGGTAASSIGGAFDPPPPTVQLPDEQPASAKGQPGDVPPASPDAGGAGARAHDDAIHAVPEEDGAGTRSPDNASPAASEAAPSPSGPAASGGAGAFDPPPPSLDLPDAHATPTGPEEDGYGTRSPDDAPPQSQHVPAPPPAPEPPSLQDQADQALARSEQADEDAVAAQKAREDAWDVNKAAQGGADIEDRRAAAKAYSDAANAEDHAEMNAADAHEKAMDAANAAKAETDPDGAAADAAQRRADALQKQADQALAHSEQADDEAVAAKKAADQAFAATKDQPTVDADDNLTPPMQAFADADRANAAAAAGAADAHEKAVDAANAAKAATDPLGAAADAAARDLDNARKAENEAFFHEKDSEAYKKVRAAVDAAQEKADAAQAAADAAKSGGGSDTTPSHRKP